MGGCVCGCECGWVCVGVCGCPNILLSFVPYPRTREIGLRCALATSLSFCTCPTLGVTQKMLSTSMDFLIIKSSSFSARAIFLATKTISWINDDDRRSPCLVLFEKVLKSKKVKVEGKNVKFFLLGLQKKKSF